MKKEDLNVKIDNMNERISAMKQTTGAVIDQTGEVVKEHLSIAKGNVTAARENMRLASEKGKSKINATLLQMQSNIDKIKEDAEAAKAAHDQKRELSAVEKAESTAADMIDLTAYTADETAYAVIQAIHLRKQYSEKYDK